MIGLLGGNFQTGKPPDSTIVPAFKLPIYKTCFLTMYMATYLESIPDFLCGFRVELSIKIEEWIPMYYDYIRL